MVGPRALRRGSCAHNGGTADRCFNGRWPLIPQRRYTAAFHRRCTLNGRRPLKRRRTGSPLAAVFTAPPTSQGGGVSRRGHCCTAASTAAADPCVPHRWGNTQRVLLRCVWTEAHLG
eukprot:gene12908-biopygen12519